MNDVILVAVNDSRAAFHAAAVAVAYARRLDASLHAVTVLDPAPLDRHLNAARSPDMARSHELAAQSCLRHVVTSAAAEGLTATSSLRRGRVAAEVLAEAERVGATLIVVALVDRPGHTTPYIGSHTLRVLEFSSVPVLVVPL